MGWRTVPLIGLSLFYGLGFGWRTWLHVRRYGSTGMMLFRSGRMAQTVRESFFLVLAALLLVEAVLALRTPETLLAQSTVQCLAGAALLFGGTVLMVVAQLDLGASWRIGIEEEARPGLVTDGLYAYVRNPIFLAMLLAVAGMALLVPTWLSTLLLVGGYLGMRQQTYEEEAYLMRTYGSPFRVYARRVGRFLPGVGRLS